MIQDTCEATQLPSVFFVWSGVEDIFVCREDNEIGIVVIVLILLPLLLLLLLLLLIATTTTRIMFNLNDFLFLSTYLA
jgi:hypothetical protein